VSFPSSSTFDSTANSCEFEVFRRYLAFITVIVVTFHIARPGTSPNNSVPTIVCFLYFFCLLDFPHYADLVLSPTLQA
jgi:hypothetical protein